MKPQTGRAVPSIPTPSRDGKSDQPGRRVLSTDQIDDNQDDLGRDVNDKSRPSTDEVRPHKHR